MRVERYASWDCRHRHMGGRGEGVGSVLVRCTAATQDGRTSEHDGLEGKRSGYQARSGRNGQGIGRVVPEVGVAIVASPVGVLELDTHSLSEADPSESSLPPVSVAPIVSPFLCSDDSKSDTKIRERHVSPTPHDAMLTRRRSRVALQSLSPTTSIPEITTSPISPAPYAIDIPIGRLYRTHPGGPCKALNVRKSIRPLHSHHLALRYTSHHLDHFTFGSSSSHLSLDHSSSGSGHSLSRHTPPDTTVADSSTPPRFVHPSFARTLWCSEAYLCWRSSPLSSMYPPTTSESSARDSSSELYDRPSRKRCRSPAVTVILAIHAMRDLVPSCADLLPPRKRFRDSISPEDSVEKDVDTDVLEDIEADATTVEVVVDRDVEAGIDVGFGMEVDVGVDVEDNVEGEVESSDRGTMEVGVDMVAGIDIRDDTSSEDRGHKDMTKRVGGEEYDCWLIVEPVNMTITHSGITPEAIKELVNQRVKEALATYEVTRAANALKEKTKAKMAVTAIMEMGEIEMVKMETVKMEIEEMEIQMRMIGGMEGVVRLIRLFEKMETVFHISNCPEKYQVKYATSTLLNSALTWWNSHKRTIRTEAIFSMSWRELTKLMAEVYCPGNEIQKMESELWNLTEARGKAYVLGGGDASPDSNVVKVEMSRDVLTVGSTMRTPLLYRGEYSQWAERFMNYLEEQMDGEAMINLIKNGDQPLPRVTQVSIAGTTSTEQPPLKDKSMWSAQEKRVQKIDCLARSLPIQGLLNDIYSLIDSNKTAKDLWDALA
nr:reverse transcriptase domain-containing protein [Tanacetum cinerariifolium]